jgi:hypothetical protein
VGTRAGLYAREKRSCPYRESNPGRSGRSPSLHRLSQPGSLRLIWKDNIKLYRNEDVPKRDPSRGSHERRNELLGAMLAAIS